jgi:hypothetical protein
MDGLTKSIHLHNNLILIAQPILFKEHFLDYVWFYEIASKFHGTTQVFGLYSH